MYTISFPFFLLTTNKKFESSFPPPRTIFMRKVITWRKIYKKQVVFILSTMTFQIKQSNQNVITAPSNKGGFLLPYGALKSTWSLQKGRFNIILALELFSVKVYHKGPLTIYKISVILLILLFLPNHYFLVFCYSVQKYVEWSL